jgi:hypothetical protein
MGSIVNRGEDLHPFGDITTVQNGLSDYLNEMEAPSRTFITSLVQPAPTINTVKHFIRNHLQEHPAVKHYYLICHDGDNVHDTWTREYAPKLVWCRSKTNRFNWDLREACAKANDLSITHCEQCIQRHRRLGDVSLAKMYVEQHVNRIELQITYLRAKQRDMNQYRNEPDPIGIQEHA